MVNPAPPNPNVEPIRRVLRALIKASPYVRAAAVVKLSGLTVAAVMPYYVEQDRVSAMSAVILLLGERLTNAMRSGELAKVYIEGQNGHVLLMAIGEEAVLSLSAEPNVPLGLLLLEMELAIEELKPLV